MGWARTAAVAALAACALLCGAGRAGAQAARPGAEEFDFYGVRFGMTPEQVRAVQPANAAGTEALDPKHGMRYLQFVYDYRNRLGEIRASYERPADGLRESALRLALKERFSQPITARWRDISVTLDETTNRAAITVVIVSQAMRQEAIEHFRDEFLRSME